MQLTLNILMYNTNVKINRSIATGYRNKKVIIKQTNTHTNTHKHTHKHTHDMSRHVSPDCFLTKQKQKQKQK